MKKQMAVFLSALCILSAFSGCGNAQSETKKDTGVHKETTAVTKTENSLQTDKDKKVCAVGKVGTNGNDTVYKVRLIPKENTDISQSTDFTDLYNKNKLHSGVVGLVGAPLNVSYSVYLKKPTLELTYNLKKLNGVRPDALMFLKYNEAVGNYIELSGEKLDTKKCTVSIDIDSPGDYMLVNRYKWLNCWGADLSDNGLEKGYVDYSDVTSDVWQANEDGGDVFYLADKNYIKSCINGDKAVFNITNSKQLASAVYYANCIPVNTSVKRPDITINIMNDIDLQDIDWVPMGWSTYDFDYSFSGTVNGNGHTISNMRIGSESNINNSGFIGSGLKCKIKNLKFKNCDVRGYNSCGIIIGKDSYSSISNCTCTGFTEGDCAGTMAGEIVGTELKKCRVSVFIKNEDDYRKETKFLSYTDMKNKK